MSELDLDFADRLDDYQQRLEDEAWQNEQNSYSDAARPDAQPLTVTFTDLRPGDYMTNEGPDGRWVKVVEVRGPFCHVKSRKQAVPDDEVSVLFEIPQPVAVSGETRYWLERKADWEVLIDLTAR